jgi:hypothetical protein
MHKQIQIIAHVQMAKLQSPTERDDKGRVECALRPEGAFLGGFVRDAVFALEDAGRQRFRRDAAGQRGVIVDVKFEQVEEFVGDKVDGAVYVFFHAEVEFEGAPGFVA